MEKLDRLFVVLLVMLELLHGLELREEAPLALLQSIPVLGLV